MIINPYRYASGGGSYTAETNLWISRATALGATPTTGRTDILDALSVALAAASYSSKIIWLNPFMGATIAEARVPLRDTNSRGAMNSYGSSAFTNSDVGDSIGIQNPTEKNAYLGTNLSLNAIKAGSQKGGLGFYERNWGNGTNTEPMGAYNAAGTDRFVLDLRSTFQRFRWSGTTGTQAGPATTTSSGHYYGQDNGTITEIYKNGASLGSNGTSNGGASIDGQEIFVMGVNGPSDLPWKGRCACAYVTDGTMSSADIAALHTLLGTYLITPTGR